MQIIVIGDEIRKHTHFLLMSTMLSKEYKSQIDFIQYKKIMYASLQWVVDCKIAGGSCHLLGNESTSEQCSRAADHSLRGTG